MAETPTGGATGPEPIDAPEAVRRHWFWLALLGAVLILGGVLAIVMPVAAGVAATLVIGACLLVGGAIQAVHAFKCVGWRARLWHGLSALIYLVGGLWLLFEPFAGLIALSLLIVAILIVDGLMRVMMGLRMRPERGWGWMAAAGAASAALGVLIVIFALPAASLTLLGAVAGVSLILEGASFVYLAFAARPRSDRDVRPA